MAAFRAIPEGYMTVGELAKKTGTTVRTLQYYDREGLLSPSAESEGGRRLYTDKDTVRLHQILSLKYLGFSLDDIKNRLVSLDTPADVAAALTGQADAVREKIGLLTESLQAIEALKAEVLQMQSVDFKKYADIIVNLQMKNELYGVIKHFDDDTLDHFRSHFDMDSGPAFLKKLKSILNKLDQYQQVNLAPESPKGQALAKEFWDLLMEFTGGDMRLLSKLNEFSAKAGNGEERWEEMWQRANSFLEPALDVYLTAMGYDPIDLGGEI